MESQRSTISALVYVVRPSPQPAGNTPARWQYLLLRRTERKGGFWQGVTGAVEHGDPPETPAEAAARELAEETGLRPRAGVRSIDFACVFDTPAAEWFGPENVQVLRIPGTVRITEHVFIAVVEPSDVPTLSAEHDAWRWCHLEEALELLKYDTNKEALVRCAAALDVRSAP